MANRLLTIHEVRISHLRETTGATQGQDVSDGEMVKVENRKEEGKDCE